MSELPSGWARASLGDICGQPTQRVPDVDEEITYIDIASVDRDRKAVTKPQLLAGADAPSRARKVLETGDVIVSMTRPNLNAVALIGVDHNESIASTGFDVLKAFGVEPRWVFAAVRSARFVDAMCGKVQGALYPAIKSTEIREYEIPLPPANEQSRIAAKLDDLLSQVDTLKARIDSIPALLKRFRQSVLAAAFSGRLTEEWRGYVQNNSTHGWTQTTVGNLCKLKSGIAISAGDEKTTGDFKYFKVGEMNVKGNELHLQYTDRYLAKGDAQEKSLMPSGSILFPKRGGAIATNKKRILKEPSFVDLNIMGIIVPADVEIMYVYRWFETIDLAKLNTGSTIPQINNTDIAPLEIPLPPSAEQSEIVRRVEQLFTYADQLETKVTSAKSRIDHLTQSILSKAFRGELVPQDPNDEPASMLLERIAASKLNKPAKSRRSRPPQSTRMIKKSHSMTKYRQDEDVLGQPYLAEHLRRLDSKTTSEVLFKVADLPVADFYKQLAWEVAQGHVVDLGETLEAKNEA